MVAVLAEYGEISSYQGPEGLEISSFKLVNDVMGMMAIDGCVLKAWKKY